MTKEEALSLINRFMVATVDHYEVANGINKRKSAAIAARKEFNSAKDLLKKLTHEPFTDSDIENLLGW